MKLELVKPVLKTVKATREGLEETFELSPLEPGLARAVFGNSLRTILLTNIPSWGVTNYRIGKKQADGSFEYKSHAFGTVEAVIPDCMDILLELKRACVKLKNDLNIKEFTVKKKGPCKVTLGDFADVDLEIVNPDLLIMEITDSSTVELSIVVSEGRGYATEEVYGKEGFVFVDVDFSPVRKVGFSVNEEFRYNGELGYKSLLMEVETDGRFTPKEAMKTACRILIEGYKLLDVECTNIIDEEPIFFDVSVEEEKPKVFKAIEDLNFSVRVQNALSAEGINTTKDFEKYTLKEVQKIDNLGKKSLAEVIEVLAGLGIELR